MKQGLSFASFLRHAPLHSGDLSEVTLHASGGETLLTLSKPVLELEPFLAKLAEDGSRDAGGTGGTLQTATPTSPPSLEMASLQQYQTGV